MSATLGATDDDVQAEVLQTALAEIHSLRQNLPGDGQVTEERSESSVPECCVICLDATAEPCAAIPCGHANFDLLCLLSWLQERNTCPLCKATVQKVRYQDARTGKENIYPVEDATKPGNGNPEPHSDQAAGEYLRRRRRRRSPGPVGGAPDNLAPRPASDLERRRRIYRHQLYSLHVGSNRVSRYRLPPTPRDFSTTPHLVSRARLWIRRELQVFTFLSDPPVPEDGSGHQPAHTQSRRRDNAEFLLEYIIAIIKTVDIQGSTGQAEDMLSDFLGRDNARLFLHELRNWVRSPCQSLGAWDREVQYPDVQRRHRVEEGVDQERLHQRAASPNGSRTWRDEKGGDHWRPADATNRHKRVCRETSHDQGRRKARGL